MVYRQFSVTHACKLHPSLPLDKVRDMARIQFKQAAQNFMEKTLQLGLGLRPNHLWGFYLFPDCYNSRGSESGYMGRCLEPVAYVAVESQRCPFFLHLPQRRPEELTQHQTMSVTGCRSRCDWQSSRNAPSWRPL